MSDCTCKMTFSRELSRPYELLLQRRNLHTFSVTSRIAVTAQLSKDTGRTVSLRPLTKIVHLICRSSSCSCVFFPVVCLIVSAVSIGVFFRETHNLMINLCSEPLYFFHIVAFQVSAGDMQNHVYLTNKITYGVKTLQLWRTFMKLRFCRNLGITIISYWNIRMSKLTLNHFIFEISKVPPCLPVLNAKHYIKNKL